MSPIDVRVRYTRMIVEESFLQLLKQKPAAKVTVTELCKKAQINRATFYKHYLDVADLLEKMEEQLFDQIRTMFEDPAVRLETFMAEMLRSSRDANSRFLILGGDNGDPNLMGKTFLLCYELAYPLVDRNLRDVEESKRKMIFHFLSYGSGGVLTNWIRSGAKESPEDVIRLIFTLCGNAIDGKRFPE